MATDHRPRLPGREAPESVTVDAFGACIADPAAQSACLDPHRQQPSACAVAHRVGGQLMDGDHNIGRPVIRHPRSGSLVEYRLTQAR
jgi:hypothetical protein